MNNEKMLSKLRVISGISVVGVIAYLASMAYRYIPDVVNGFKDGWNSYDETETAAETPVWKMLVSVPCGIAFVAVLAIIIVAGLQLLFQLSKGNSPFNEKVSKSIKNLGVSCIVFEIVRTLLMYTTLDTVHIGMLWLAGLVLCAFSLIFRYGTILQQESDETL